MASSVSATKSLVASCYCKAIQYTIEISTTKLPLPVNICHCSICRYTHGTLCIFHAILPVGGIPKFINHSSFSNLTGYKHDNAQSERYFCTTCGCHIGDRELKSSESEEAGSNSEWIVATSLFSEHGEDIFQIRTHCFTEGSNGGKGLFTWLPKMGNRDMKFWNPGPDDGWWSYGREEKLPEKEFDEEGNEVLRAECHCGGVSFTIPRPTIPAVKDDSFVSQWISPKDPNKWMACLDVCDDCRLHCGTHVVGWTFVPRAKIQPPMPQSLAPYGTMKTYVSSKGVLRGFCWKCGATVIFSCDDRNPNSEQQIIDVSIGILRAPEGILAENWLTWRTGRVGWLEDGEKFDPVFAKSLAEGLKDWSLKTYGDAWNFDIQ
ncbi:hypothetical protein VP1G_02352 [Cytospora mali]|uniref:CENP-V/GFA domain-containing protein n=1 Tax=Cytospora mali TaxID=578113 RepID=A0A194UTE4_CYTMA|nr:hypothetical protein VP1G_02352 [Valsa mali var. pyri (nom. inval.)]